MILFFIRLKLIYKLTDRTIGLLAIATPLWFALLYFVMSSLRVDFSHATKAVSELGSLDAPNRWAWNVGGYILPGLSIALLGVGIARHFHGERGAKLVSLSLIVSGLLMVMSGVFPGDFDNRTSPTMILHTIGALGSFLAFLVCGFAMPWLFRRHSGWSVYAWPSLGIVALSIAAGFFRTGNAPGIGQRLGFLCFFLWVGLVGIGLFRNATVASARG